MPLEWINKISKAWVIPWIIIKFLKTQARASNLETLLNKAKTLTILPLKLPVLTHITEEISSLKPVK
jgi:hypothetical protein